MARYVDVVSTQQRAVTARYIYRSREPRGALGAARETQLLEETYKHSAGTPGMRII